MAVVGDFDGVVADWFVAGYCLWFVILLCCGVVGGCYLGFV